MSEAVDRTQQVTEAEAEPHGPAEAEQRGEEEEDRFGEEDESVPLIGAHPHTTASRRRTSGLFSAHSQHGTFNFADDDGDEDFTSSCPSGCSRESVYRFAVVYPELHRIRRGTYYSCEVCISLLMLLLTALCQFCIVQIAGGWIVTQNYNQYKSSVQSAEVEGRSAELKSLVAPYVEAIHKFDDNTECCNDVACSARIACCIPDLPSAAESNHTKKMKIKSQRLDSVCHEGKDGALDCAQPSFQLIGRWHELDIDGDKHWTHDEALADAANLGCRLQLTQQELLRAVCLGIQEDYKVKEDLGIRMPKLPFEIEAMHAVPLEYFELWEGLGVICAVIDPARCGSLVNAGVFDGALGLEKGSWNLVSALEYCGRLLMPGGMCDKTLPVTYALHRQSLAVKCGQGVYSAGPLYMNPHNDRDSVRAVSVEYKEVTGFELVHSFQFKFFVWIMLVLWLVTLNKELEAVFSMLNFVINFPASGEGNPLRIPRSMVSFENMKNTISETVNAVKVGKKISEPILIGNKRVVIKDISNAHRIVCWCALIVRTMDLFYMLIVGILYATCTHSYLDLLMNTVALAFVFELPELFFQWLVPEDIKDMLNNVELKPFTKEEELGVGILSVTSDMAQSRFFQGLALIPIVCVVIVQFNDLWRIRPMLQVLRCACKQSGADCEVAQHLTRDWWDDYWNKVGHFMK